jgi:hypothetical protein
VPQVTDKLELTLSSTERGSFMSEEAKTESPLQGKPGPIDRATDIFMVLGWGFSFLYLWNGGSDWRFFTVINATLLIVSFIGGVITAPKPKPAPADS